MNQELKTMSQAEFKGLSAEFVKGSKTDWAAISQKISASGLVGKAISSEDFYLQFCGGVTSRSKGHVLWALKRNKKGARNVKAAAIVADRVAIRYDGNQAWLFLKPQK